MTREQVIKRYRALLRAKQKHNDRWGMIRRFPRQCEIDALFRWVVNYRISLSEITTAN